MPSKIVKLGLVGVGHSAAEPGWQVHSAIPSIAWSRYFPQIRQNPAAELVAVCDRHEDRAKKAVDAHVAREYYTNFEQMLDKADIEAVIITTPHAAHASMTTEALRAGKHVMVEKPLASTFEEADKVVEESKKAKGILMALPAPSPCIESFLKVKDLIEKGDLGKICFVRGKLSHGGPGHAKWFYQIGGGVAVDLGIAPITKITTLLGPASKVQAFFGTAIPDRIVMGEKFKAEAEDNALISLDFGSGTLASVETNYCSILEMEMGTSLEVYGTEGVVFLDKRDKNLGFFSKKALFEGIDGWIHKTFPTREYMVVELFIESIINGRKSPYTGEQQRHVIEILEGAHKSAETGKSIQLTSSF